MKTCDWFLRSSKSNDFGCSIASPLLYRRGVIELVDREYQSLQGGSCLESLTNNAGFPRHGSGAGNSLSPPSEQARSDDELENHSMMEIDDDSLSTFYVLNAGDIGEDLVGASMDVDDVNEGSLIQTITFHSVDNNQESIDNVFPNDLCTIQGVEIIPTSQPENDNSLEQTDEEENEDKSESEGKEDENEGESESSDKEMEPPRFILNLYPPEEGYTYSMADSETEIPESHLIPYSERYIIDSVDNGIVPWKVISALKDQANFDLMSCKNNVLTEIRDYRHFSTVSRTTPKIRHVLLKPNNQSLLSDLDDIIEKGFKEKAKKDTIEAKAKKEAIEAKSKEDAIEAKADDEDDTLDSQYIEEIPEPEPILTPSPERIKMEPVDYEAVICKVEPSLDEMTNADKNNLFTEVNDCKPFSVGSPPIPPAPDEPEDVKPGVQSLLGDFKRTAEDNDPEKEASSDTDSQKESDGESERENSEVDNSGVVVPYCRTSDEDQESLHRSTAESSEEEDATDDDVENLNFRFLRTKCDHRYDKQHYSRNKSFGTSSETDSDSSVDTGSLCDSDNISDSTSYKRSSSSFSSNNEESNNRTGKRGDSSDNDSDSFINNDGSNAGSESSGSDNGSRGRNKGRKESENEETNYDKKAKSDKEKSIWSIAAVQKALEDKEYFITTKNPFPPNRMLPRKKKKHRPRDKRKELRGSPSAGFSGNISSNDSDNSDNDNCPSTTIVTKGLILKEKHPAGLLKDHQRALFGRQLTEQENPLFEEDEPDTQLRDETVKVHKIVDSASNEFLESNEENIVANLKNAEINIAHLLKFIKEKKQNLVESVRLVEPKDDKLSATPSSSQCLAIQNSSDLEADSTVETIDNDLDANELELVKFEGNTNDDADSVVSEEFDEEEQNIIQEAICGLLDGTHLDVLAEEVNSAIEIEFEASLRDLMNQTDLGVEEHPESEPEEDFDAIASRLQLEIIKVDPKDGSKLVRCPDGLLLMVRGKEITPISELTDEDGDECSYILNKFSKSPENPTPENETTCTTVAVYNDTTQETNTENDNTQTSEGGYRQVEVILSIKEEAEERMEFHVNETSVTENSFANTNHIVNNDKILINGNCIEEGKEKFNHQLANTSTTTVDKQVLSCQNHENYSNDLNHQSDGYGNSIITEVYNGNGNYPTISIKNEFKHHNFDGIIVKQEVQCKQEPEEPMEVDKNEPGVKNCMVKVKDENILSNGTHMEDVDEFLNSVQNKSYTVDEQQNTFETTQSNNAQENQMDVDVSNQLVLRYETNESEANTITMYVAAAPVEVEESTATDQVVVQEEQKSLKSVEETSSDEDLVEFNKIVTNPNYDELTEEEVEALLNSEGCEKLLHEVTSDLMLEASTDDFLIKGAQLCYIEEMNRFYRNAYEKAALNRDNPVYSMTEAELEKEIDLEFEASKFYLHSSDDIADLSKLDMRMTSPSEEDLENIKHYEEEFLSKEEMEDFMKFRYSLEDFIPTDEDAQLKKIFDLCDEEKEGDDQALEEEYYKYNDEDYFSEQALVIYLKEQLQNAFSQDEDSGEENGCEVGEEEYEEYERVDKERMLEALKKDAELNYDQRLSLEKILVNQTSEKLCLDPSPDVGVLVNRLQYEKLKWNAPELKKAVRNWTVLDQPVENHFHRLLRENPDNEHVRAHLKRKRDPILRQQKPIELNANKFAIKRPRTLLEPRELTLSKLLRGDTEEDNRPVVPPPEEEDGFYEPPEAFHCFYNFVMGVKAGKQLAKDKDKEEPSLSFEEQIANPETRLKMLTLEPPPIIDFMDLETPANLDVMKKMFKAPDPAVIQSFPIENTCRVIEEYLLETDRRKKPHYTKVTIYQRNYLENYHGEVLMESLFEPLPPSPQGKFPRIPPYTTCEFGLGCSSDVALYIKQFLDIFSEDGKRACKVTYHKIGQPFPFVLATPYYKPIFPEPPLPKEFQFTIGPNTVNPYPTYMERSIKFPTQGFTQNLTHLYHAGGPGHAQHHHYTPLNQSNHYSQSNSNSYGFLGQSLYNSSINASTSSSSTSSSSSNSQPPVQIVHPQPRPVQQREQIIASSSAAMSSTQIYGASSGNPVLSQTMQQPAAANVNFNVNLNSSSIVGISPQQVLTRPHIVNVNVQQQAQQSVQTRPVNVPTQQQLQQLAHQRNLRMRQQQLLKHQQYIQQHPTALAKLLTTNLQGHVGGSGINKPITVAVPPQPQNPNKAASNPPQSPVGNLTMSIGSPIEHHPIQHPQTVSPSPNVSVNVNTAPNVNVNLNTISLDGLLSGSQSNINYSTSTSNIVTSNVSVVGNNRIGTSISPATALNILRLNAGSGGSGNVNLINTSNLQRGLTVSNLTSNNVSIMSPPQQRILVNSAGNVLATTQNQQQLGELEEISVTDLNTFLNSQQIQISQLGVGQQVALSQNHPQLQQQLQIPQQHIQTLDSHNVNLNLNVNLNSGSGESSQQIAKIQGGDWTTTTNSNAPFVVFISPLTRPLNSENSGQNSLSAGQSSTVNVNLAALQAASHSSQPSQTIVLETTPNKGQGNQQQQQYDAQNLISSGIVGVTSEGVAVDTLFNALSDAIGPELGKKLDVIGGVVGHNTVVVSSTVNVPISSPVIQSRISPQSHLHTYNLINMQSSPSSSHTTKFTSHVNPSQQNTSVITLNDLLGSPTLVSSSAGGNYASPNSFILNTSENNSSSSSNVGLSNGGSLLSPIAKSSASPNISGSGHSNVVSSTPRLSALLAGTPSADSQSMLSSSKGTKGLLGENNSSSGNNSLLANAIDASHSTASYGNLLDRLAASLSQPPGTASQIRTGVSRLNPIASATPNVVLEHPMLAASLTQPVSQQSNNRATAYRQIAPAPPPNLVQHGPPQQLINLLGLTSNTTGQARTIRISATTPVTGKPSPGSGNMGVGR